VDLTCIAKNVLIKKKREKRKKIREEWNKGGKIEGKEGRRCTKCKLIYPENNEYFGKHKTNPSGLDTYCKICRKEVTRESYHKNKTSWQNTHKKTSIEKQNKIIQFKNESNGCNKCGEKRYYLLDFHHIDPKTKLFQISQGGSKGWNKIEEEIKKCLLLCKNCHTDFHYQEKTKGMTIEEYLIWFPEK
jgi:Zn finger protein HypA/HybF involved in hydrogenase expression